MENILLNVDSRFRMKDKYPNSAKFSYKVSEKIKNCKYVRVSSIEFPNLYWTFNYALKSNTFFNVTETDPHDPPFKFPTTIIPDGFYDSCSLLTQIQTQLDKLNDPTTSTYTDPEAFAIKFNCDNGLVSITNSCPFSVDFSNNNPIYPSLGYLLGFREKQVYISVPDLTAPLSLLGEPTQYIITGDTPLEMTGDTYIFLRVNDYGVIKHDFKSVATYRKIGYTETANIQGNESMLAKIILGANKTQEVFDNGANFVTKSYTFRQPTNIQTLEIELLDPYGQIIQMGYLDYSFTLEFGVIYDTELYGETNKFASDKLIAGLPEASTLETIPTLINGYNQENNPLNPEKKLKKKKGDVIETTRETIIENLNIMRPNENNNNPEAEILQVFPTQTQPILNPMNPIDVSKEKKKKKKKDRKNINFDYGE